MSGLDVRVARKTLDGAAVAVFELRAIDGSELPPFTAGAHVDVHLPGGAVRQYSLCNAPWERDRYLLGVQRAAPSRGGSVALHEAVHEGAVLQIGTPRNLFALAPASHTLLLGAGIGITPLLAMAEQLYADGASFALHYSVRHAATAAFRERLATAGYADRVNVHASGDPGGARIPLERVLARPDARARLCVCGPAGYIADVLAAAGAQGWRDEQVCVERFSAESPAVQAGDAAFDVVVASSGLRVRVAPGRAVHEALAEAGVEVPVSCEQGVCGTCVTRVLAGVPDHRDSYLDERERASGQCMALCCSRAKTPELVLDL
ncbi:MAG: oxidoreductase [Hydrogenophaga sp.]|uniref:PDR/VanB family oxidoreductase n=1 Tax=Hydrogenophaga sp. TaxID=1904254 RepID=UPI00257C35D3|nr:PDR/VanB family oxidoreductase [Hydrogenophaga sp.]MBL0945120.1 oxidoreductase [Hydrogenophaga sp.]